MKRILLLLAVLLACVARSEQVTVLVDASTGALKRPDAATFKSANGIGSGGGSGTVTGPTSSSDKAIARFDGTGGDTIQNSSVYVTDNGDLIAGGDTWLGWSALTGRGLFAQRDGVSAVNLLSTSSTTGPNYTGSSTGGTLSALAATPVDHGMAFSSVNYDGTNWFVGSRIQFLASEQSGASARGNYIAFSSILTGATSLAERIRVSGSGNLLIGTTSDTGLTGSGNTKTGKIFYDESGRIGRRTAELVTQTSHGFSIGNVLYLTGTTWTKAKADAISTSNALGVVESVPSSDTFIVVLNGTVDVTSWGLSANTTYYLSDGTAGLLTSTAPTSTSSYLIPVLRTSSTTVGYIHPLPVYPLAAAPVASGGTGATTSYGAYDNLSGPETTVASATTTDLGAVTSNKVSITGTTTITGFGTVAAGVQRWGRFTGALTLTHNATSLILPGAANITTAAGDSFHAVSLGSGNWAVYSYQRANGKAVIGGYEIPLRQGNNSMTVAAAATVYIGYCATATAQQGRYKETIRLAGTITDYTFSFYGSGGGANNCTVTLLLNGVTTVGSTTVVGNVFPGSVTVTGLTQAVSVGDTIEVTFLNHASNSSITSFIGGATVTVK